MREQTIKVVTGGKKVKLTNHGNETSAQVSFPVFSHFLYVGLGHHYSIRTIITVLHVKCKQMLPLIINLPAASGNN